MTRDNFIRKWLGNKDYQFTEENRDKMRDDLDKVTNKQDHIVEANKMVSSLEWLMEQITYDNGYGQRRISFTETEDLTSYFEQAKEMEKEQIIVAWIATDNELQRIAAEQYYNETYGGKQQTTTSFSFAESNGTSTTFMCSEFISDGLNNTITKCMNCGKEIWQHYKITNIQ